MGKIRNKLAQWVLKLYWRLLGPAEPEPERETNDSGFLPNGDLVLVLPPPVEEKTAGGIVIPDITKAKEGKAARIGTVISIGREAYQHPRMRGINVGDKILFARYSGDFLPIEGIEYIIMRAEQVLGPTTKVPDYAIAAAKSSMEAFG